jgi:hypothetical protein
METRHPYRGFIIEAHPYELRDLRGWSVECYIERHDSAGVTVTHFYFDKPRVFETQKAAIEAAVAAACKKIDAGFTPPLKEAVV